MKVYKNEEEQTFVEKRRGESRKKKKTTKEAGVTVKSVRPRIWSGGTDNASRFCPGGQITLADLVLPPQIWSG